MLINAILALVLTVSPIFTVSRGPSRVTVQVRVTEPFHQMIIQIDDGENYFRESQFLNQQHSLYRIEYPDVPNGDYTVTVGLMAADGRILRQQAKDIHLGTAQ